MSEVKEKYYVVVNLDDNEDEDKPPYIITTDFNDAINTYKSHIEDSNCYVGTYINNKLVEVGRYYSEVGKYYSMSADSSGIFHKDAPLKSIDLESI